MFHKALWDHSRLDAMKKFGSEYIMKYLATAKPRRENWMQNITDEEKAVLAQHFEYTHQQFAKGNIVFDGACLDGTLGIIVYQANSEEEAMQLFNNDPLVKSGIMETQLRQFRVGDIQKA